MKIIKIAQGGGVPNGFVKVDFSISEEMDRADIVGHAAGDSCSNVDGEQLIKDVFDTKVDGFGDSDIYSDGETTEGKLERQKNKPNELLNKPVTPTPQFGGPWAKPQQQAPNKINQFDQGYDV